MNEHKFLKTRTLRAAKMYRFTVFRSPVHACYIIKLVGVSTGYQVVGYPCYPEFDRVHLVGQQFAPENPVG